MTTDAQNRPVFPQMNLVPPKAGQHPGVVGPDQMAAGPVDNTISKMSVVLCIKTSMDPVNCGMLASRIEHEDAVVVDVTADWLNLDDDGNELPASELEAVKKLPAFIGHELVLHQQYYDAKTEEPVSNMVYDMKFFSLDKKGFFTAEELMNCILEWEKVHRNAKIWHGAVDAHHVFLESMRGSTDLKGVELYPPCFFPSYGS